MRLKRSAAIGTCPPPCCGEGSANTFYQPRGSVGDAGAARRQKVNPDLCYYANRSTRVLRELNPRIPAAFAEECLRIRHLQNLAEGPALVGGPLVVGLDDAIANPIAEISRLFQSAIVEPAGKIGLVLIGDERGFDFFFAPLG